MYILRLKIVKHLWTWENGAILMIIIIIVITLLLLLLLLLLVTSVWKWELVGGSKNNGNLTESWTAVENSTFGGRGLEGMQSGLSQLSSSLQLVIAFFFFQFFHLNGQNKEHDRGTVVATGSCVWWHLFIFFLS